MYQILGIGELLWDMLPAGPQLGGAPANYSVMASRLGNRAAVVSRIGKDELGRQALEMLTPFPVDTALMEDVPADQRNISLMVIRPNKYRSEKNSLHGFLHFQREFNQRMFATRLGKSESYELLELYAMIHPMFYYIARYFMPDAMGEILGTAGVTILKDAEMFVSPLTDLQINGFIALGNLMMPTEDGKTAGAVSICGSRALVREYIKAIYSMTENYPEFLHIEL